MKLNEVLNLLTKYCLDELLAQETFSSDSNQTLSLNDERRIVNFLGKMLEKQDAPESSHYTRYTKEYSDCLNVPPILVKEQVFRKSLNNAKVIYFGDYHNIYEPKKFLINTAKHLIQSGKKIIIAMESIYKDEQKALNNFLKEKLSDADFKREVNWYKQDGGIWFDYDKRIYSFAIKNNIKIIGTDSEGVSYYDRDILAADAIFQAMCNYPKHTILNFSGDQHIAKTHLPRDVKTLAGESISDLIIYQNFTDFYWKQPEKDVLTMLESPNEFHITTLDPLSKFVARYLYNETIDITNDSPVARKDYVKIANSLKTLISYCLTIDKEQALDKLIMSKKSA